MKKIKVSTKILQAACDEELNFRIENEYIILDEKDAKILQSFK